MPWGFVPAQRQYQGRGTPLSCLPSRSAGWSQQGRGSPGLPALASCPWPATPGQEASVAGPLRAPRSLEKGELCFWVNGVDTLPGVVLCLGQRCRVCAAGAPPKAGPGRALENSVSLLSLSEEQPSPFLDKELWELPLAEVCGAPAGFPVSCAQSLLIVQPHTLPCFSLHWANRPPPRLTWAPPSWRPCSFQACVLNFHSEGAS